MNAPPSDRQPRGSPDSPPRVDPRFRGSQDFADHRRIQFDPDAEAMAGSNTVRARVTVRTASGMPRLKWL